MLDLRRILCRRSWNIALGKRFSKGKVEARSCKPGDSEL
jgi:hypothetical protein